MNMYGKERIPFLFVFDFLMQHPLVFPLDQIDNRQLRYAINGQSNQTDSGPAPLPQNTHFSFVPPDRQAFQQAFDKVMHHLRRGDTYLLNLTMPVDISTSLGLDDIYRLSKAPYKLWMRDQFTVFSPEPFVRIVDGNIYAHPMKGTIDATLPDAARQLLANKKELAEHYTIVDLIRNDLNMVASNIRLEQFRYVEEIVSTRGRLLQTSSRISGRLPDGYLGQLGDIMLSLLPAGSISGAPKKKTVSIIREAEQYERNYYTGVFGLFDGHQLDSGVMIRFVEQQPAKLVFKAGGGITVNSSAGAEYAELMQKVYLPVIVSP